MSSDLETRVNGAVMARLSNASGLLANGQSISIIYDRAFTAGMNGQIDGSVPMCQVYDTDITANALSRGSAISIGGVPFTMRDLHPDGTGLTVLMLEEA